MSGNMIGNSSHKTFSEAAIWMENVCKSYGRGKNKCHVLRNLNLRVPRGAIYGLLGASGCGKTTLLKCVVGKLRVDEGEVMTLGAVPGSSGHDIPGCRVGYMPQETALYRDFTISETMIYFGILHGMSMSDVCERTHFLLDFLRLPEKTKLIKNLSGGQQRRVSFAAALLQEPELLILDEPTVGVDPLLRERIWKHMLDIAQSSNTTIIITTHYIEEAKQADMVGFMRNGHLLAEQPPSELINLHKTTSLELVFLLLCERDQMNNDEDIDDEPSKVRFYISSRSSNLERSHPSLSSSPSENTPLLQTHSQTVEKQKFSGKNICCNLPRGRNILASVYKNLTQMKRKLGFILFQFIFPSIQIVLFCLCIGRDPFDLNVAVVNQDEGPLGKTLLHFIDNNTINQVPFHNFSDGLESVKKGDNWGLVEINENFTIDLMERFTRKPLNLDNITLDGSTIKLHLDMTNEQIALILQEKISAAFIEFASVELIAYGLNPNLIDLPVKVVEPPVYGEASPSFTNFMAPGIVLSITFFMATGLTTLTFVLERKEGLLERSFIAGMTAIDILVAHLLTQVIVMAIQVILMLVFAIAIFKVPYHGSLFSTAVLVLLQGLCGMNLGILFSAVCDQETSAIQLALSSVYPNLLLSGIIWPLEAIPTVLQYFSKVLPMTYGTQALRAIMSRGWNITSLEVYRGYLVTIGWCLGLLLVATISLRVKL